MTLPALTTLYGGCEATWPAASARRVGPWTIRDGAGGGKRVSAATADGADWAGALDQAEAAMEDLDQPRLFMLREGETALDVALAARGYGVIDPVHIYACPVSRLLDIPRPRVSGFAIWEPLAIMKELWAEGGIGPARVEVMRRATSPKTAILGRHGDRAAATAYVGLDQGIAMLHALEVAPDHRRQGVATTTMGHAAHWAQSQGAKMFSVLVTQQNTAANALYSALGMEIVGGYHYRIR